MADLVTRDTELSKALVFDPLTKALRREDGNATLPGQARVSLCDEQQMDDYLQEAISVDQLDRISPYFKYVRFSVGFFDHS